MCTFIYDIDVMKNIFSPKSKIWYDKSNFTFQTFVLAGATAGTTVSAASTTAATQIGKFVNENFYWLINSYLEFL